MDLMKTYLLFYDCREQLLEVLYTWQNNHYQDKPLFHLYGLISPSLMPVYLWAPYNSMKDLVEIIVIPQLLFHASLYIRTMFQLVLHYN